MAGAARAEEPAYNVCEAQIRAYLADRFDQSINRIEFRFQNQTSPTTMRSLTQAIVYPNECPGYHFFELNADEYNCERQAHYGKTPNYLQYRSTRDGC